MVVEERVNEIGRERKRARERIMFVVESERERERERERVMYVVERERERERRHVVFKSCFNVAKVFPSQRMNPGNRCDLSKKNAKKEKNFGLSWNEF